MKMGLERRVHLRESGLQDSALLSRKEIKKRAEKTPATFRDEQVWDPLCIALVRAAELLFCMPSCHLMLLAVLSHGCKDVLIVALDFSHEARRRCLCPKRSRNFPSTEQEAGVNKQTNKHIKQKKSNEKKPIPRGGERELRYLKLSKELILGGFNLSQIPVICCTSGSLGGGHWQMQCDSASS